ncbi:uncharacterized protein [Macrobrachium rosenbergii]|uniref:uncharacterized protein isoform X2 n=1 Tax=Macrobrachium rosenbergii TaxID=79674 RepID=UPI0034D39D33
MPSNVIVLIFSFYFLRKSTCFIVICLAVDTDMKIIQESAVIIVSDWNLRLKRITCVGSHSRRDQRLDDNVGNPGFHLWPSSEIVSAVAHGEMEEEVPGDDVGILCLGHLFKTFWARQHLF